MDLASALRAGREDRYREILASLPATPTTAEALDAMYRVGRNHAPALLFDLYYARRLDDAALAPLVHQAWTGAEWPERSLTRRTWLAWFRLAAYPRPDNPIVVYRGAPPRLARGMAWTTDRERAAWFANRWITRGAHVYTATARPEAVMADIDALEGDGGRREAEIVVDPALLPELRRSV